MKWKNKALAIISGFSLAAGAETRTCVAMDKSDPCFDVRSELAYDLTASEFKIVQRVTEINCPRWPPYYPEISGKVYYTWGLAISFFGADEKYTGDLTPKAAPPRTYDGNLFGIDFKDCPAP